MVRKKPYFAHVSNYKRSIYQDRLGTNIENLRRQKCFSQSFTSGLGRTYRYWRGPAPLFEFGHGLSLTNFSLEWTGTPPASQSSPHQFSALSDPPLNLSITVRNAGGGGTISGEEVVLLFAVPLKLARPQAEVEQVRLPFKRLIGAKKKRVSSVLFCSVLFCSVLFSVLFCSVLFSSLFCHFLRNDDDIMSRQTRRTAVGGTISNEARGIY
jgi:hypothetical protein